MALLDGFHDVGEVVADSRGRMSFGKKVPVRTGGRYLVSAGDDGTLVLTPAATIPARELDFWNNTKTRASVMRGLDDAAAGRTRRMDDLLADDDLNDE